MSTSPPSIKLARSKTWSFPSYIALTPNFFLASPSISQLAEMCFEDYGARTLNVIPLTREEIFQNDLCDAKTEPGLDMDIANFEIQYRSLVERSRKKSKRRRNSSKN